MLRRGMILGSSFAKASPLMGTMSAPMLGVGDAGGRLLSAGPGAPGAPSPGAAAGEAMSEVRARAAWATGAGRARWLCRGRPRFQN